VTSVLLRTQRLILREWRDSDLAPYLRIRTDPHVMRFYPRPYTNVEVINTINRQKAHQIAHGFSVMAVEAPGVSNFIGAVGCKLAMTNIPRPPAVELAWTLDQALWGQGYAVESARAVMDDIFARTQLPELIAYTAVLNLPSQRVMQKLGMVEAETFDLPSLDDDHPLRPHVIYRIDRARAQAALAS
jgi:RimJ/RimL family protein N-acetyltransferase